MESALQDKRVKINFGIALYTTFTVCIAISDYLQYLLSANYWLSLIISFLCVTAVWFLLRKNVSIKSVSVSKGDIVVIVAILLLSALRIAIPANDFDTNNYHLYFQEYLGRDFINSDFFPIRACNAHYFILGDRMAWLFRKILGYRLGVVLNTLVLVLIYFQVKDIVVSIDRNRDREIGKCVIPIVVVALFTENLLWNMDTHLIDTFAIPFLLEAFRIALLDRDEDVQNGTLAWVALVAGCAVSIKMSNAFCLLVPAVFYIIRFRKKIKPIPVLVGVMSALLMVGIYMWIGFEITGNPVFPYCNGIFKSEYFSLTESPNDYSAFYARFGPSTFIEYLIWPVTVILHPEKANDMGITSGRLLTFVVIFLIWIILFALKKTRDKQYLTLLGVWLVFYVFDLTLFQGYSRYVIIMDILGGVLAGIALWEWFGKKGVMRIVSLALVGMLTVQTGYLAYSYVIRNYEPAWRYTALADWSTTKANAKLLLRDHEAGVPSEITDDIDVWGVVEFNGSQLAMIKDSVPIIGLTMAVTNEKTQEMSDALREQYKDQNMYTALMKDTIDSGVSSLSSLGYEVEKVIPIQPTFIDATSCMLLMKIKPIESKNHMVSTRLADKSGTISIPADTSAVKLLIGQDPYAYTWGSDGTPLEFYITDGNNETVIFSGNIAVEDEYVTIEIPEDLLNGQEFNLHWRKNYVSGSDESGDWLRVIVQCFER
ncbi:MAG: hypothetical protein IJX39_04515 [Clostridia bacterium]|nr:hypothetical protein [Clostridia bacterium]